MYGIIRQAHRNGITYTALLRPSKHAPRLFDDYNWTEETERKHFSAKRTAVAERKKNKK